MRALDLFCGGGGVAIGLRNAGFETVVGIDNALHKNYPGDFVLADALRPPVNLDDFDFVWASPPCQRFSLASHYHGNSRTRHPDFIPSIRKLLEGHPFSCIENVPLAPIRPDVILSGPSVGLPYIVRVRHFEISWFMLYPTPVRRLDKWKWESGKAMGITKNMGCKSHWYPRKALGLPGKPRKHEIKNAMGIPQDAEMTQHELGEAVPPAYAEYIARGALDAIKHELKLGNGNPRIQNGNHTL